MITELTSNFEETINNESKPVVVEFYSPTCGTCMQVAPIVEKIAKEFEGEYKFYKINVENDTNYAKQLGVSGVPTFLFMKQGEVLGTHHGNFSKGDFINKMKKLFA
jgi:thioredoxin 1